MIHVAIISHGHEDLLIASKLGGLLEERTQLKVWVKDNKPSAKLKAFCLAHTISYTDASPGLGFGHNNNFLFEQIQQKENLSSQDIFLVMNPDITVAPETIYALVEKMQAAQHQVATLNLYRDQAMRIPDTNIRHFPGMLSILKMPLVHTFSETYDKDRIATAMQDIEVEWASGAFLAFTAEHYKNLGGFDPSYFMYFEDVDICYRSRKYLKQAVHYYPSLKAIHTAAHKNRNIASQHARWFFHSFFKFLVRRYLHINAAYPKNSATSKN
jgi:hypothetical protein